MKEIGWRKRYGDGDSGGEVGYSEDFAGE